MRMLFSLVIVLFDKLGRLNCQDCRYLVHVTPYTGLSTGYDFASRETRLVD